MKILRNIFLITLLLFSSMLVASEVSFSEKLNRLRAQMGELNTQNELYNIDFEKDDLSNIIKWTKLAAEQGETWAFDQLGAMYFYGIGVEQDYKKSFDCYQKVAAKGFPGSEWGLGDFYLKGIIVQQDTEKAVSIYFNCAKAGNPMAAYRLVTLYKDQDPHFAFACCFICNSLLGNTEAEKDLLDEVFQIVWDLSEKMNGREVIAAQLQADSFLRENNL